MKDFLIEYGYELLLWEEGKESETDFLFLRNHGDGISSYVYGSMLSGNVTFLNIGLCVDELNNRYDLFEKWEWNRLNIEPLEKSKKEVLISDNTKCIVCWDLRMDKDLESLDMPIESATHWAEKILSRIADSKSSSDLVSRIYSYDVSFIPAYSINPKLILQLLLLHAKKLSELDEEFEKLQRVFNKQPSDRLFCRVKALRLFFQKAI